MMKYLRLSIKNMKLSGDKKIISRVSTYGWKSWNNHNYGATIIPSLSEAVCQWDLRINKLTGSAVFSVGI